MNPQTRLLTRLSKYLNLQAAIKVVGIALAVGVGVALIYCLLYIIRGHSVPLVGYLVILVSALVVGGIFWLKHRKNIGQAAVFADKKWKLKDIFTTAFHMREKNDESEVSGLVQSQADEHAAALKGEKLSLKFYRKRSLCTVAVFLLTLWMLSLPPSASVQAQLAKERMTEDRTAEVKSELEEYIRKLEEDLDDDEKEALRLNELKKWVKELKKTNNEREALRQFAKLEQKISKNINKLEQRKDEATLKKVAAELMKAPTKDARKLGKDLELKEYKKAATKLKDLKLKPTTKKPTENRKPNKLTERQKKIAKLRALAKRMARANGKAGRAQGKAGKMGKQGAMGKQGKAGAEGGKVGDAGDLQKLLDEFDGDLEALEKALQEMEMADEDLEWGDELMEMMEGIDEDLDEFAKRLRRMAARRKARSKLKKLRRGLAQSQSYAMGQSQMLGLGGKKAGDGTDSSKRKEKDKLKDNGQFAQLSGIKNKGPSKSSIEEAESGTGVSGKRGTARKHSYQRAFESFVHRDDIPEDLKSGVREYLKNIHQAQPDTGNSDK